nr:oligosaccharide flippase family protein [Kofleriaceae bacterium]
MSDLQRRVDRSTAWVAAASGVLGVLDVLSTLIVLQLWVTTANFGTATIAAALMPLIDRLGGLALSGALVREHEPDDAALSSVFWLGLGAAVVVLAVLVAARPLIALGFGEPVVGDLVIAFGFRLVVQNVGLVPDALMKKELRYRELSLVRVASNFCDVGTKLGLAFASVHGAPELAIWCFVLGPVAGSCAYAIGVQLRHPWRPRLAFRRDVAARAARFTAAVQGGDFLYYAYTNADYLVVGAWFGDAALGAYRLAYELVLDVVRLLSLITAEVAFPTFVKLAGDTREVAAQLVRFTRQNLIVIAPFLVLVVVEADDLLSLLYPPLPPAAATAARILAVTGGLRTMSYIVPPMLAGLGDVRRVVAYQAIAAVALPAAFVLAVVVAPGAGFVAVAVAWSVGYPIAFASLLAMALPRAQLAAGAYGRALAGVVACAAVAMAAGWAVRLALPEIAWLRAAACAAAVVGSYGLLLARIEGVTPAGVVRSLRAPASPG